MYKTIDKKREEYDENVPFTTGVSSNGPHDTAIFFKRNNRLLESEMIR